jgi:hypothetical protein
MLFAKRRQMNRDKVSMLAVFFTLAALVAFCCAQSDGNSAPTYPAAASRQLGVNASVPDVFTAVLAEVKTQSRIAVLLPSRLSRHLEGAKYAVVEKAAKNEYAISLNYKLGIGDAGFAALFAAEAHPGYAPGELGNVRKVKLSKGLVGYFRPVSCGGSCAPANLWWEEDLNLYQIQLVIPPSLREADQQNDLIAIANSSILAGPR